HAMSNEQDMRSVGGLKSKLPITFMTMLLGTIAISGIPPFSGFFSKDEILAHAFAENKILWVLGFVGALFTAFYMFRMMYLTFFGTFRGTAEQKSHVHESPSSMTIPLIILAVLSVVGGLLNVPSALGGSYGLANFLAPVFERSVAVTGEFHLDHSTEYILMGVSTLGALAMAFFAYQKYVSKGVLPEPETTKRTGLENVSYNKFYIDEIYDFMIVKPLGSISSLFHEVFDKKFIDGIVNGIGSLSTSTGRMLRLVQNGNVGFYIFLMVVGAIIILGYGFFTL